FVAPNVPIEKLGIDCDFFVRFWRRIQRDAGIQQMLSNVVHTSGRLRVRERDHSNAPFRIETDECPVSARAAVMPDSFLTFMSRDVPPESNLHLGHACRAG